MDAFERDIKKLQDYLIENHKNKLKNGDKAVDAAIRVLDQVKTSSIPDVSKALPTDERVEQWWAEGQDQKNGFWQEAPYRTNGDVIEEIKTALKYFIETWQR